MANEAGDFLAQVQEHLVKAGASATLNVDEQDIVNDFAEQQLGVEQCACRIVEVRSIG